MKSRLIAEVRWSSWSYFYVLFAAATNNKSRSP